MEVGSPCPNKIIYIKINAANKILLFSATIGLCPSIKIINKYNKIPIIKECKTIVLPCSIYILLLL